MVRFVDVLIHGNAFVHRFTDRRHMHGAKNGRGRVAVGIVVCLGGSLIKFQAVIQICILAITNYFTALICLVSYQTPEIRVRPYTLRKFGRLSITTYSRSVLSFKCLTVAAALQMKALRRLILLYKSVIVQT